MREGRGLGPLRQLTRARTTLARVAIVAGFALLAVACRERPKSAPESTAAPEPPAPAPEALLAEATMRTPDATWLRVQRGVGGAAGILPSTLGGMVTAVAAIDPQLAPEIDGASPAFAALAGDPASPAWAVAVHLRSEARARSSLVEGETARFDAHDRQGLTVLVAKGAHAGGARVAIAIARGGWLVVARSEDDLVALAPYATRTLPARAPRAGDAGALAIDVPGAALAGPVRDAIARRWAGARDWMIAQDAAARAQHGGRAPDFGDARAIVAALDASAQRKLAVLADLRGAHVAIDPTEDDVRAIVTAQPASAAGAASAALAALRPGDVAPLLATPRDAAVAILTRDDADARARDASDLEAAIAGALGPRLVAADAKRAHAAIDDWTAARGANEGWATYALVWSPEAHGVVLDAAAEDPARATRAVREAAELAARAPAIREPLRAWLHVKDVTVGASLATFVTERPPSFALAWAARPKGVSVALGDAPLPLVTEAPAGRTLGDDPAMRALLAPLGSVAGAVVVQPSRAPECAGAPGGLAFAWGRRDVAGAASMWGALEVSDASLRCLAARAF